MPFIQTGDIAAAKIYLRTWTQTLNDEGIKVSKTFPPGTIFITIAANIGNIAISTFETACPDSVVAIGPKSGVDRDWLFQSLITRKIQLENCATQNAQKNINLEILRPLVLEVPPLREQRRIAEILRTWDEAIDKTEQLIASKGAIFDAFVIALLKGHRRLNSDNSNWPLVSFADITTELSDRNPGRLGDNDVMGVNKQHGMIPMKDHVRADDLSRYKLVPPNAFAYNPMRLNIGSLAKNQHGRDVLVSPDYAVFEARADKLDPRYFDHLRRTSIWGKFVGAAGTGSVRIRIYYEHLTALSFHLPSVDVQSRIADIIDTAQHEIDLIGAGKIALEKQKRGLMQKLLTGEWAVPLGDGAVDELAQHGALEAAE